MEIRHQESSKCGGLENSTRGKLWYNRDKIVTFAEGGPIWFQQALFAHARSHPPPPPPPLQKNKTKTKQHNKG